VAWSFVAVLAVLIGSRSSPITAWSGYASGPRRRGSDIDVQLKRRTDLVPNLVDTVKGSLAHERGTLDEVVRAPARRLAARTPETRARSRRTADGRTCASSSPLAEAYPI